VRGTPDKASAQVIEMRNGIMVVGKSGIGKVCLSRIENATGLYEWPDSTVEVGPFLDSLGYVKSAPIVTAVVAYDNPTTGKSILVVVHQAILIHGLEHNVLCPMQLRHSGISVHECPKHGTPIPARDDRGIIIPDGNYMIPLSISGVTSYFPSRKPTREERDRYRVDGDSLELTPKSPIRDPYSTIFTGLETFSVSRYGELEDNRGHTPGNSSHSQPRPYFTIHS
jgi:hypothetical protein